MIMHDIMCPEEVKRITRSKLTSHMRPYYSILKAARAVLFHATNIHCHHSRGIMDPSFYILEWMLHVCTEFDSIQPDRIKKNGQTVTKNYYNSRRIART